MALFKEAIGWCPICGGGVTSFQAASGWLRDEYKCANCGSIPRERALMHVLNLVLPEWRRLRIHESSPAQRGASEAVRKACANYTPTHLFPGLPTGEYRNGIRCEDLQNLTFPDAVFDVHITQDVFEHVPNPARAFQEIARTLAPGGAHVFTVPLVRKKEASRQRAIVSGYKIEHLLSPKYHGNPVDPKGSLVITDWGYDIIEFIYQSCGLFTERFDLHYPYYGIEAEYIDVLVTRKPFGAKRQG